VAALEDANGKHADPNVETNGEVSHPRPTHHLPS
jgi:hypothetical protein